MAGLRRCVWGVSGMLDPEMSMNLAGILGESLSDYMHVCMHHIIYAYDMMHFIYRLCRSLALLRACTNTHTHTQENWGRLYTVAAALPSADSPTALVTCLECLL